MQHRKQHKSTPGEGFADVFFYTYFRFISGLFPVPSYARKTFFWKDGVCYLAGGTGRDAFHGTFRNVWRTWVRLAQSSRLSVVTLIHRTEDRGRLSLQ